MQQFHEGRLVKRSADGGHKADQDAQEAETTDDGIGKHAMAAREQHANRDDGDVDEKVQEAGHAEGL